MRVNICGVNLSHTETFFVNRMKGSGDNLFIHTRTPVLIMVGNELKRYPAETTVFFRKDMPQIFMAAGYIYADDYIHFNADDEEMEFIDSLGIPSGVPFTDLDSSVFLNIHRYICIEQQAKRKNKEETINLLLRYFMIKLAHAIEDAQKVSVDVITKTAMNELRTEIYANVGKKYKIEELAARVGLSPSYFQVVYKNMFGQTCINDVIFSRIDKAMSLLRSTDYSISEIARMCGFESDSYFVRQFKKHTGVTPSAFRTMKRDGHSK